LNSQRPLSSEAFRAQRKDNTENGKRSHFSSNQKDLSRPTHEQRGRKKRGGRGQGGLERLNVQLPISRGELQPGGRFFFFTFKKKKTRPLHKTTRGEKASRFREKRKKKGGGYPGKRGTIRG